MLGVEFALVCNMTQFTKFLLLAILLVFLASSAIAPIDAQLWANTEWTDAHATFYGGQDASGTMGGACGYGNLYDSGYGTQTAALSDALFNDGLTCGACFALQCKTAESQWCYPACQLTVTATNNCPYGSTGGWCDSPKLHFDLSYPAFTQLAQAVAGVIPVQYKRVPCVKQGGIRFAIQGNVWFNYVLVMNVADDGDVNKLCVRGNGGFIDMVHNWGQFWSTAANLAGQPLSFQVTSGSGRSVQFMNVAPSWWAFGQTYEAQSNF